MRNASAAFWSHVRAVAACSSRLASLSRNTGMSRPCWIRSSIVDKSEGAESCYKVHSSTIFNDNQQCWKRYYYYYWFTGLFFGMWKAIVDGKSLPLILYQNVHSNSNSHTNNRHSRHCLLSYVNFVNKILKDSTSSQKSTIHKAYGWNTHTCWHFGSNLSQNIRNTGRPTRSHSRSCCCYFIHSALH